MRSYEQQAPCRRVVSDSRNGQLWKVTPSVHRGALPPSSRTRAEDAVFRMLSVTWEGTRIDYAEWVACQITEDFLWEGAQGFMSRASARGPARGRRRKQAEERLEEIEGSLRGFEWGLVHRIENSSAQARERKRRSMDRLEAARTAMTQRKDVDAEWVIKTFGSSVDGLKAGTILPDPSPMPP